MTVVRPLCGVPAVSPQITECCAFLQFFLAGALSLARCSAVRPLCKPRKDGMLCIFIVFSSRLRVFHLSLLVSAYVPLEHDSLEPCSVSVMTPSHVSLEPCSVFSCNTTMWRARCKPRKDGMLCIFISLSGKRTCGVRLFCGMASARPILMA